MRRATATGTAAKYFLTAAMVIGLQTGCIKVPPTAVVLLRPDLLKIAITEINFHPIDDQGNDAEQFEFIEIKDTGSVEVDLTDVRFDDGITYDFPANTIMKPNTFIIVASNASEFKNRYGVDPFGVYSGKLSNSGEKLSLKDIRTGKKFLSFTYGTGGGWPKSADGGGSSLVPSGAGGDAGSALYWRASFNKGGSPGKDDPGVVLINEILPHTDPPDTDAIELYNPNNAAADIGNWYLTDSKVDPAKFHIPAGTTIPAMGYVVFTASSFNADPASATSFALSEHGDQVYLSSDSMGFRGAGYCTGYTFGENENGVSYGRYVNSVGVEDLVALKTRTLGAANSAPGVGPVVMSEIMYHPKNGIDEYIELANTGAAEIPLYDAKNPKNTWKIGGIDFTFPENVSIKSNERMLIISDKTTEAQFRSAYAVNGDVKIFFKTKNLSNAGDTLAILKPSDPYIDSTKTSLPLVNPYIVVERISYTDASKWHSGADGTGQSLQRKLADYANDPASWSAGTATPGK